MAFTITKQDACFIDARILRGAASKLHYIVRRTPFTITIAVTSGKRDFNKGLLECTLCQDQSDLAPVANNPLEFLARPSIDGQTCVIECRVMELSSHTSAKSFRIKITHQEDGRPRSDAISAPIISVAKQQQVRNRMAEVEKSLNRDTEEHSKRVAKRPRSEDVITLLDKIASTQARHEKLLRTVASNSASRPELNLEEALDAFVRAYEAEDQEQRPTKLRRLLDTKYSHDRSTLGAIGCVFSDLYAVPEAEGGMIDSDSDLNSQAGRFQVSKHSASARLLGLDAPDHWHTESPGSAGSGSGSPEALSLDDVALELKLTSYPSIMEIDY